MDGAAADDAVFTADTGMCCVWAARDLDMRGRRELIGSFRHGSMANALPQAIGAQLAFPGRQVITCAATAGSPCSWATCSPSPRTTLPVKVVVFNNGTLGMVKMEMLVAGLPDLGTKPKKPGLRPHGRGDRHAGIRVEDPATCAGRPPGPGDAGAGAAGRGTNPNELSMPPKVSIPQAWGFNVSMLKELLGGRAGDVFELVESNLS